MARPSPDGTSYRTSASGPMTYCPPARPAATGRTGSSYRARLPRAWGRVSGDRLSDAKVLVPRDCINQGTLVSASLSFIACERLAPRLDRLPIHVASTAFCDTERVVSAT